MKKTKDVSQLAASIVEQATGRLVREKNPAAVALGRLGGLRGGKARAEKLTVKERVAIAKKAARARWDQNPKI